MGGIKKTLFGSPSEQTSESGNHAWEPIKAAMTPALSYVTKGGDMMGNLLGVGGGAAQTGALENWANSGGMKFLQEQGMRGITSSKAASGLLNSGSYGTALAKYNQGLASTYLNQYMNQLSDYSKLGLGAGGLMSSAGGWSKGQGEGGKAGMAPQLISAVASIPGISDRRLKKNIKLAYTRPDGLNVYDYDLFGKRTRGVMADEVKEMMPEAYIHNLYLGYDGVDYAKIGKID